MSEMVFAPEEQAHRRKNLLTGEWVLVSPHRTKRPWQGQVERVADAELPVYDAGCYLCPGNERAGGVRNPNYATTYVFDNDFAALLPLGASGDVGGNRFFQMQAETGFCRVVCFSPRHDLTLPQMEQAAIEAVVEVWCAQTAALAGHPEIGYVQLFENKGAVMGCSNPHPHGQVWATRSIPVEPLKEDSCQRAYFLETGRPLLLDYLRAEVEVESEARIVVENEHWVALVPFWAVWPFETMLLPRRHVAHLPDLEAAERSALAAILKQLLTRYDNLFDTSFPYSMGWHGRPVDGGDYAHWQLHAHFYPPLLRSATVKKFMVGYEMLAMPQRDITAEQAAARLRAMSEVYYRDKDKVAGRAHE